MYFLFLINLDIKIAKTATIPISLVKTANDPNIIEKNGGIMENEIVVEGDHEPMIIQRFWIGLN